jgi:SAM-dependent methyltransferase
MNQKEIFLSGEGDNWIRRNESAIRSLREYPDVELLAKYVVTPDNATPRFLEVGCGGGNRTLALAKEIPSHCFGVDPSRVAIDIAKSYVQTNYPELQSRLQFKVGTADSLDYPNKYFDLVYFGFCLYLVDRSLLTNVFNETCRVLKPDGFVAILDFYASEQINNVYKHDTRVTSFKDRYDVLFESFKFVRVAHLSLLESGSIGFETDDNRRIGFTLLKRC